MELGRKMDIVELRKRKKRRRFRVRLLIGVCIVAFCIFLYAQRNVWFPKLEGIGNRYQNVTQNENADVEGYFPLSISGGVNYYTEFIDHNMFILCDMYLYIYGQDGSLRDNRQHTYSNAVMHTSGSRCLLYSSNGKKFRVDNVSKMLYEVETEQPILFASIGENGYVAVVTESETYSCKLMIYDKAGKNIYSRECVERLMDVSFCQDGCIFSTIGAENGDPVTQLKYIRFTGEASEQWSTSPLPTFCQRAYALSDGGAFVIGDTKCAYYSSTGALLSTYDFDGVLTDYYFEDDRAVVLLKNEERRQTELLLFADPTAAPVEVPFSVMYKSVFIDNETVYMLGTNSIESFAFSGQTISTWKVTDAYDTAMKNGKYFYLFGYDKIDRINVNGS